jgi:hypothetical protein
MPTAVDRYIKSIITEGGWELRYSPQGQPFAVLPQGFGSNEAGIRLFFSANQEQIKVIGVIDHSDKLRIKRPFVMISAEGSHSPGAASEYIKTNLIPRYREVWPAAQPKIEEYLYQRAEREQTTEEVRRVLNLYQHMDLERGVEVLTGRNLEAIINNDLSVALKMQVPKELAIEIMKVIKQYREQKPAETQDSS